MFVASLAFTYAFTHKDYLVAKNKVCAYISACRTVLLL
jgi:hypothetical protein